MKPTSFWLLFGLAVCGLSHEGLGQDTARVGSFGNPAHFAFEGVAIFREEDIRSTLQGDLDIVVAGHPLKRRELFLRLIEQRVTQGYRAGGCPNAKVEARFDDARGQIVVRVDEGSRYTCGPIVVTGCRQVSVEDLIAWLTKPKDDEQKTKPILDVEGKQDVVATVQHALSHPKTSGIWRRNEPANFSEGGQRGLEMGIRDCLADQGFFSAQFTFEIEPSASGQPATLRIRIDDEGPVAALGRIEITGLKRHTQDEVLDFLKLRPGMPMKGIRANDLEQRLEQSARFIRQSVKLTKREQAPETAGAAKKKSYIFDNEVKPASGKQSSNKKDTEKEEKENESEAKSNTKVFKQLQDLGKEFTSSPQRTAATTPDLQIDVKEFLPAPKLNEPLSREEQALQKVAKWFESWPQGEDDLAAELIVELNEPTERQQMTHADIRLAASPRKGLVGKVHLKDSTGRVYSDFSFIYTSDRIAIARPSVPTRLEFDPQRPLWDGGGKGLILLGATFKLSGANNPGETGDVSFQFGFPLRFNSRPDVSPLTMTLAIAPVTAMSWGHDVGWMRSWQGETLRMEKEAWRIVADSRTGRVIECFARDERFTASLKSGRGLFDQAIQQFDKEVQAIPNAFDLQNPLQSIIDFSCQGIIDTANDLSKLHNESSPQSVIAPEQLSRFCSLLRLAGRAVSHVCKPALKKPVPRDPSQPKFRIPLAVGTQIHTFFFLSPLALGLSRDVFAEETWPWSFSRATAFLVGGKQELASESFKKLLESPSTGPIGCLTIATAMTFLNPAQRRDFAVEGLSRLNLRSFRRDYQVLLHEDAPISKVAVRYVELLRDMPPDELRQLVRYLADGQADSPIEQALLRLVQDKDQPPRDALIKFLDELWEPVLMPKVKQRLEALVEIGEVRNVQLDRLPTGITNSPEN